VVPGLAVQAVLFMLYLGDAIPPVPLSLKFIDVGYDAGPAKVAHAPAVPPSTPAAAPSQPATGETPAAEEPITEETATDENAEPTTEENETPPEPAEAKGEAPKPEAPKSEPPKAVAAPEKKPDEKKPVKKKRHHAVEAEYQLTYQPAPWWKFWRKADPRLELNPGERAWVAVRIFAPTDFRDRITYVWERYDEKKGWHQSSSFSSSVSGGREHGFRSQAFIQNGVKPGDYRVEVNTADGREIGSKRFSIAAPEPGEVRETAQMPY